MDKPVTTYNPARYEATVVYPSGNMLVYLCDAGLWAEIAATREPHKALSDRRVQVVNGGYRTLPVLDVTERER